MEQGSGLYLDASDSELNTIKSVTIANNVLDRDFASGGGVFALLVNSTANFMDSTISGNSSSGDGGGVYFRARGNGSLNFVGSTIADNIGNRDSATYDTNRTTFARSQTVPDKDVLQVQLTATRVNRSAVIVGSSVLQR